MKRLVSNRHSSCITYFPLLSRIFARRRMTVKPQTPVPRLTASIEQKRLSKWRNDGNGRAGRQNRCNPLHRSDTWKLSLARLVFADSMTRMALLPPKGRRSRLAYCERLSTPCHGIRTSSRTRSPPCVFSRALKSAKRESAYSSSPLRSARK